MEQRVSNSNDFSDYKKPRTKLHELLPDVYDSDVNRSVFENTFNRFLTKPETKRVYGAIGKNTGDKAIVEYDVHRQAHQLQPALYNQIGSVKHMATWKDLLNELIRHGIDPARLQEIFKTQSFNWVPPVDIDKIVNYGNYYWYDQNNPNSRPQYITVRRRCSSVYAQYTYWQRIAERYGTTFPIAYIIAANTQPPDYNILYAVSGSNVVVVDGDARDDLIAGQYFQMLATSINDGVYKAVNVVYEEAPHQTFITVNSSIQDAVSAGAVRCKKYDRVAIVGDFTELFVSGFEFFIDDSLNEELNSKFFTVENSQYNERYDLTEIKIGELLTDNTAGGVITFEDIINELSQLKTCYCDHGGWDLSQWDDNFNNPLWDNPDIFGDETHEEFLQRISHPYSPINPPVTVVPVENQVWYDTEGDTLYQYGSTVGWKALYTEFSTVLAQTRGGTYWDIDEGCQEDTVIKSLDQWVGENRWYHINDVPNFSLARKAQYPIIEFLPTIEMNEWTRTSHVWKYRSTPFVPWEDTEQQPSIFELQSITMWQASGDFIMLDSRYGDLTGYFTPGLKFKSTTSEIYEVDYSYFSTGLGTTNAIRPLKTYIKLTVPLNTTALQAGDLTNSRASATPLFPLYTSRGDLWRGYDKHWLYVGTDEVVPSGHITDNFLLTDSYTVEDIITEYYYAVGYYNQRYIIRQPNVTTLMLYGTSLDGITIPLTRRALAGTNDVRVYVNNVRQYGNYAEIVDGVVRVVEVDVANGIFYVNEDVQGKIIPSDTITLTENTSIPRTSFNVLNVINNRIYVQASAMPSGLKADGVIHDDTRIISDFNVGYVVGVEFETALANQTNVNIQVGEGGLQDIGFSDVPVRTIEEDNAFISSQKPRVSLIKYRKEEQVKQAGIIQSPLFDIYRIDGTFAGVATPIFSYYTENTANYNAVLNGRVVFDDLTNTVEFRNYLYDENTEEMFAYRDYINHEHDYWYNHVENKLYTWTGYNWFTQHILHEISGINVIRKQIYTPFVGPTGPEGFYKTINGILWFDTQNLVLKQRNAANNTWDIVDPGRVVISSSDTTLQSVWRKGLNEEEYIIEQVDWKHRTFEEYEAEREEYVATTVEDLIEATPDLPFSEALTQATQMWYETQSNTHSVSGEWVGDWEVPDPLYYNNMHEDREVVKYSQLFPHFRSIIEAQDHIPGYIGSKQTMAPLIPLNEFNYGLAGTIKEYKEYFNLLFSALFVDELTPIALFDFARDQYESLINHVKEVFYKNSNVLMTDVSATSIIDLSSVVVDYIIEQIYEDDLLNQIYGDSTTYDENTQEGMRNWIATMPYFRLIDRVRPHVAVDANVEINDIVHHDGHRGVYSLGQAVIGSIVSQVVHTKDQRTKPSTYEPPLDTFGRISALKPPNTITEFASKFNTDILNRSGVYWYYTPTNQVPILYRLNVVAIGQVQPSSSSPDGTLWLDLDPGAEVLRIKITDEILGVQWNPVSGLSVGDGRLHNGTDPSDVMTSSISAWQVIDIEQIINETIFEIETRLYNYAPHDYSIKSFDFYDIANQYPDLYNELLYDRFLNYAATRSIYNPFGNTDYTLQDPWTWNYKYSIIPNYPASTNTGTETGGYWKDLYFKLYNTPYPHLEPWCLQGYKEKPVWWDEHYLNNDSTKWGSRRWKYKHGFEIIGVDDANDAFAISGDFIEIFYQGTNFLVGDSGGIYDTTYDVRPYANILDAVYNTGTNIVFTIPGNQTTIFTPGVKFNAFDTASDYAGTFTVMSSSIFQGDTQIILTETTTNFSDFNTIGGALYSPSNNRTTIYVASDITTTTITGRIQVAYGMWENIRVGKIPAGVPYPNGNTSISGVPITDRDVYFIDAPDLPTFSYFSTNIMNNDVQTYGSDDLLPPYWNYIDFFGTSSPQAFDRIIRSAYFDYTSQIRSPGTDYLFGDRGVIEWQWRISTDYLYDQLNICYRIDPIRTLFYTFGTPHAAVGDMSFNLETYNTFGHQRITFHGDVFEDALYKSNGINQWYVNYLRYKNIDLNSSDFRSKFTGWTAPLIYQFASYVDINSVSIDHKVVPINKYDYEIVSKKSSGVLDYWLDALRVFIYDIPPRVVRYNNESLWQFIVGTYLNTSRTLTAYNVQLYDFYCDKDTNVCSLYTYEIADADQITNIVSITGDKTQFITAGLIFDIYNSVGNDGVYTVKTCSYDQSTNQTIISVEENIISSDESGLIKLRYRTLPWTTGDIVVFETEEKLPVPLVVEREYFIIVDSPTTFRVAFTPADASTSDAMDFTTSGVGTHRVGKLHSTFKALEGTNNTSYWRHYVIDKTFISSVSTPFAIKGMQNLVNFVFGYYEYLNDVGWEVNANKTIKDATIGYRLADWQIEVEKFIDYCYKLRDLRFTTSDKIPVIVDPDTSTWTYETPNTYYKTGDKVKISSSNNVLPAPLTSRITYYIIVESSTTFKLASSSNNAKNGIAIDITSIAGIDQLYLYDGRKKLTNLPEGEINGFRWGIWFKQPYGIITDITGSNITDLNSKPGIYDQYGRIIAPSNLTTMREDQRTQVAMYQYVANDVEPIPRDLLPYADKSTFIHMATVHLFVDTYEHVLKFNNYTADDLLIYDSFIGLYLNKYTMLFDRQIEFTERPNVGGHYIVSTNGTNLELRRNFEAAAEDLRYLYDTYVVNENTPMTIYGRKTLGYTRDLSYLDNISINNKSQFLFWKGMIQSKGSTSALTAFLNSKRFLGANVDEFWAFKIAEFGSVYEREYPEIYLESDDVRSNETRLEFIRADELCYGGYDVSPFDPQRCGYSFPNTAGAFYPIENNFEYVVITDQERWPEQPEQVQVLENNGRVIHFELKPTHYIPIKVMIPSSGFDVNMRPFYGVGSDPNNVLNPINALDRQGVIVFDNDDYENGTASFYYWNKRYERWVYNGEWDYSPTAKPIIRHNMKADAVIFNTKLYSDGTVAMITGVSGTEINTTHGLLPYLPNTRGIRVFKNKIEQVLGVDYVESVDSADDLFAVRINFAEPLQNSDMVDVVYTTSKLIEDIHYRQINSNIIEVLFPVLLSPEMSEINLWGLNANKPALNPAKLVDTKVDLTVMPIPLWDPARNHHYYNAIHVVDIISDYDPVAYQEGVLCQFNGYAMKEIDEACGYAFDENDFVDGRRIINKNPWLQPEAGKIWLDVSNLEYVPYYDTGAFPDVEDRISKWGKIAEWSTIEVNRWVESNVPPDTYDALAAVEESNTVIDESIRKSGSARTVTYKRTRPYYNFVIEDVSGTNKIKIDEEHILAIDDIVVFSTSEELPAPLVAGTSYQISDVSGDYIDLYDTIITSIGTGTHTVAPSFQEDWEIERNLVYYYDPTIDGTMITSTSYSFILDQYDIDDVVNVYVNGEVYEESYVIPSDKSLVVEQITQSDRVHVVRFAHVPTEEELAFNPNEPDGDDGTTFIQYRVDVPYNTKTYYNEQGVLYTMYYFWVKEYALKQDRIMSAREAQLQLVNNPAPYMFFMNYKPSDVITIDDNTYKFPDRFTRVVLKGLRGYVEEDRRYALRFTRDFALRDDLIHGKTDLDLKNIHDEWMMIRQNQLNHVPRFLWDKIVESIVGYKLNDSSIRVPALDRVLYDQEYGTTTRFGLAEGQSFTNGASALNIIIQDLTSADNTFYPISADTFLTYYSFDTQENIKEAMDAIYILMSSEHVNRMFFEVLYDALSHKRRYPGIMKTSWISLYGIKPLLDVEE